MTFNKTSFTITILALLIALFISSCTADEIENDQDLIDINLELVNENNWEFSGNIWNHINAHRTSINQPTLEKDTLYATAYAMMHTQYMITIDSVNHHNFFERSNGLKARGASKVSETVAYAYNSPESVVNAWLNSDTHKTIIEGNYTHVGFGVQQSSTDHKFYFTLLFYR